MGAALGKEWLKKGWKLAGLLSLFFASSCARWHGPSEADWLAGVRHSLSAEVERLSRQGRAEVEGESVHRPADLVLFYRKRHYEPAWVKGKALSDQAPDLVSEIRRADRQGLSPAAYHLAAIERLERALKEHAGDRASIPLMARLDQLLSDAFLAYADHLAYGCFNPQAVNPDWAVRRDGPKPPDVLARAIADGKVKDELRALPPPQAGYRLLMEALQRYRELARAGGWLPIPPGPKPGPGLRDPRVPLLRARLAATGELPSGEGSDQYDASLEGAVREFQRTHGLAITGRVDELTATELSRPVAERLREIEANLERWRWFPREAGLRYVLVNIAGFQLAVDEEGRAGLTMPIVVGKSTQETPVLDGEIRYLVLNPSWTVPNSIVVNELAPEVARDPDYLARKEMVVYDSAGRGRKEIPTDKIDWRHVTEENWHYVVSEPPGPKNPLGSIKFIFANPFSVYLHGSPLARDFTKPRRTESHGCIRVQKPLELAALLLRDHDPPWTRERLLAAIALGKERVLALKRPIGVHLVYRTVWVDEDRTLHFARDVYDWDRPVLAALDKAQLGLQVAE